MFRKFKKSLTALAALAMTAAPLAGCSGSESSSGSSDTAKFGFIVSQTGGAGAYGETIKNGVDLAVEQINANNDKKIELLTEDDKSDKNEAINAMNKLVNQDEVLAVEGPTLSGSMFAAGPIANDAGCTVLGTSTTAEGITDIGDYVFRNSVPESTAVAQAVEEATAQNGYKTAAIMYSLNNDQMVSVEKTLQETFAKLGVEVVEEVTFNDGDTDYSAQVTKVKQANPDVIAVASLYQEGALIVKNLRKEGMMQDVIGSNGFNGPNFTNAAGDAADNAIVGTPWFPDSDSEKVKEFKKAYTEKFGKEPDQFAAQSYDGMNLLYQAWKDSGYTDDRDEFREALANIKDFEGVTGQFKFDDKGDPDMQCQVLKVKGGKFVPLDA